MTRLERFMGTARGMALGTVIAAALYPGARVVLDDGTGHGLESSARSLPASYLDGDLRMESMADFDGNEGFATPFAREMSRLEARMEILKEAEKRLARRNATLHWAMQSFDSLHQELESLVVVEEGRIDPHGQVRLLSQVMVDWVDGMKADWHAGQADGVEPARAVLASSRGLALGGYPEHLESLEQRLKAAAEGINVYLEDNARTEGLLKRIVAQLEVVWGVARNPQSDVDQAMDALFAYSDALAEYYNPADGDEIAAIIEEDARESAAAGMTGLPQ